MLKLTYPD